MKDALCCTQEEKYKFKIQEVIFRLTKAQKFLQYTLIWLWENRHSYTLQAGTQNGTISTEILPIPSN